MSLNYIRMYRKKAGLTQDELAEKMNIGKAMISHLERGSRQITQTYLETLSKILHCSPNQLLYGPGTDQDPYDALKALADKLPQTDEINLALNILKKGLEEVEK